MRGLVVVILLGAVLLAGCTKQTKEVEGPQSPANSSCRFEFEWFSGLAPTITWDALVRVQIEGVDVGVNVSLSSGWDPELRVLDHQLGRFVGWLSNHGEPLTAGNLTVDVDGCESQTAFLPIDAPENSAEPLHPGEGTVAFLAAFSPDGWMHWNHVFGQTWQKSDDWVDMGDQSLPVYVYDTDPNERLPIWDDPLNDVNSVLSHDYPPAIPAINEALKVTGVGEGRLVLAKAPYVSADDYPMGKAELVGKDMLFWVQPWLRQDLPCPQASTVGSGAWYACDLGIPP